jgi:5'(3')-deoxyribonucleotidase
VGDMADLTINMALNEELKEEYFERLDCQKYEQKSNQELGEIIDCYVEDNWLNHDDFLVKLSGWFKQKKYFTAKQRRAVIKHLARLPDLD